MKAVIMAGGEGTRLRPVTLTRPKPLVPVAGEACIDYVIKGLVRAGVKDIIITTGYRYHEILEHTGDGSRYGDAQITFSIERTPMGTAGGVKQIESQDGIQNGSGSRSLLDETFIVTSGDVVADVDFSSLIDFHKERKAEATMALTTVDEPSQFGIVGIDGRGAIQRFKEKPPKEEVFSNLINAGIYILEPSALELVPQETKFDFSKQLFPLMLEQHRELYAQSITGLWKDIGNPFDLIEANMLMIQRKGGFLSHLPEVELTNLKITPPFMAGENVELSQGTVLDRTALYPSARIGNSRLEDCVVLDGARVGDGCRIIHSFIGKYVTIGPDCVISNSVIGDHQTIPSGSKLNGVKILMMNGDG